MEKLIIDIMYKVAQKKILDINKNFIYCTKKKEYLEVTLSN